MGAGGPIRRTLIVVIVVQAVDDGDLAQVVAVLRE